MNAQRLLVAALLCALSGCGVPIESGVYRNGDRLVFAVSQCDMTWEFTTFEIRENLKNTPGGRVLWRVSAAETSARVSQVEHGLVPRGFREDVPMAELDATKSYIAVWEGAASTTTAFVPADVKADEVLDQTGSHVSLDDWQRCER
ncbi:hypothetical protein [Yimella sp. cx-51]|uniref:hypothetical protein n=1 Tax=Yimella sp. cx-51 TaxID=2770551 RepID=UPI00165E0DB1|nr:hypothetical protein [Yimella sp. cx-51]MBC9958025.1 hypothetical protein [Yimella sp. cx-51]QTH38145.1 hypothetical protein J5M86_00090 [Yimella sp. cx-51]